MAESTEDRERRFRIALVAFREGRLLHARLGWKALWDEEDDDTHKTFLQALVQIVAALEKRATDPDAAQKLLALAAPKLAPLPDAYGGLDVAGLRASIARVASGEGDTIDVVESASAHPWSRKRAVPPKVAARERPAYFREAMTAYAEARFFEAHELWEDLWRDETDAFHKNFLQALIQVAAAMHKLGSVDGKNGALHLLGRALLRLEGVADGYAGIAVARLVDDCRRALSEIERGEAPRSTPRIEARD